MENTSSVITPSNILENNASGITSLYILTKLNDFRKNRELIDVTLLIDGVEFECHKIVLALFSDYFATMFTNTNFPEHKMDRIKLPGVDKTSFSAFLDFAYTGNFVFTSDNISTILVIGKMLLAPHFEKLIINYAESCIDIDNAVEYYILSKELGLTDFTKFISNFVLNNIFEVLENKTFLNLQFDMFEVFLSELELVECDYFDCIIKWVKFDLNKRLTHFDTLLESVHFNWGVNDLTISQQLSEQEILLKKAKESKNKSIIMNCMYVIQHGIYLEGEMRFNIFSYPRNLNKLKEISLDISDRVYYSVRRWRDPNSIISHSKLALLSEELFLCYFDYSLKIKRCNLNTDEWNKCAWLDASIDYISSLLAVGRANKIYASFTPMRTSPSLYCYNADIDNWFVVNEVQQDISGRSLVAHDNVLYLCGGATGRGIEGIPRDVITLYDPRMKTIQDIGSLNTPRCDSAAAVHNNNIFVTGGSRYVYHVYAADVVQRFDIVAGKTEVIPSMKYDRWSHSAVSYNNKLWVAGKAINPVETYNDDSCSWIEKKWDIDETGKIYLFPR